jgi:hypothetical protein
MELKITEWEDIKTVKIRKLEKEVILGSEIG